MTKPASVAPASRRALPPQSRRAVLLGLGALALAAPASTAPALAQAPAFSRITVDVRRLQELGLGPYAGFVRANLSSALQREFAGRVGARGAPELVVRITTVQLSSWAGDGDDDWRGFGGGGGSSDYMDGEALVMRGREVLARHPQLLSIPSSSSGPWYAPNIDQRRTVALCQQYAMWLARNL